MLENIPNEQDLSAFVADLFDTLLDQGFTITDAKLNDLTVLVISDLPNRISQLMERGKSEAHVLEKDEVISPFFILATPELVLNLKDPDTGEPLFSTKINSGVH